MRIFSPLGIEQPHFEWLGVCALAGALSGFTLGGGALGGKPWWHAAIRIAVKVAARGANKAR
jgi:hypothetical protein